MGIFVRIALILSLAISGVGGQTASPANQLVTQAQSCPPPLAADAMLRIVVLFPREKPAWKMQTIEQAFELGSGVEQLYATRLVPGGLPNTVAAASAAASQAAEVDRLSLQLRAVHAMLPLD